MSVATSVAARPTSGRTTGRRTGNRGGRLRRKLGNNLTAYLMMAGGLICFALFSWYPIVRAFL
ncbi:MAG TPA: sugar ABC transporter permease, partial [Pseudonocardiaceae bacterium]